VRKGVAGLLVRVLRKRAERLEPPEAVTGRRHGEERRGREDEAAMVESRAGTASGEGTEREEDERHPLHEHGRRPGSAGPDLAPRRGESERADDERCHPGVVVAAAREVDGEQRIPARESAREDRAGREQDGEPHGNQDRRRRQRLVDPGCGVLRLARGERHGLRGQRERRPVDGRRVAPVLADVRKRRILREVARRVAVRVRVVHGGDAAVAPVGPRIGGEQERSGERDELDRDGERGDEPEAAPEPCQRDQRARVQGEGRDERGEERPGVGRIAFRMAPVQRDERRVRGPREAGAGDDEREHAETRRRRGDSQNGGGGGGGSAGGGGGSGSGGGGSGAGCGVGAGGGGGGGGGDCGVGAGGGVGCGVGAGGGGVGLEGGV